MRSCSTELRTHSSSGRAFVHGAVQNLTCPWHNAGFCVRVVTSKDHQANVRSYPVRVANGSLEIEV